jgi:anthranilate/para-aminobenzoate synthase component II
MKYNLNAYYNKHKNKPILGIIPPPMITEDKSQKFLYLNDGYIKFFRQLKINMVIIPYNISKNELEYYLKNIDGLFFSGARIGNYNQEKEFINQYKFIDNVLERAIQLNNKGRIFPIYASCHGIQSIVKTTENRTEKIGGLFDGLDAVNYKAKIQFINNTSNNVNKYAKYHNNIVIHNCTFGITPAKFYKTKHLQNEYNIIAIGRDRRNKKFVDFIKHKTFPIYAFQCHPEKSVVGLLDEFIESLYKSYILKKKINKTLKVKKISFKPKKLSFKTKICKKLQPKVQNVVTTQLRRRTRKNTKCHIIKIN